MSKRLEDLVVDGEQIGASWVMKKPRRKPKAGEFLVIITRSGWIECPLCELQLGSSNLLIEHLRYGCDEQTILCELRERAERVIEGEDWDLAEFIMTKTSHLEHKG